ncbi:thiamine-phosphate kinase [Metabacillus sp. FJAT-53654]|uniref:Thiamine-monophosphate kinase n=1 Tax=Metabacillus rhizosphaerae TaxID=3117747 RepID=A0ABZ2MUL9_9BACI
MDEFDFISKIKPNRIFQKNVKVAIGDDAAVYEPSVHKNQVVCVDSMVEGVHFLKTLSSPREIGYKSLAVNISDIAAMGANPIYYLVSIAIPSSWEEHELLEIFKGMQELAEMYQMDLLGGDTVSTADKLTITVTVIGEVEPNVLTLRSNARDGDIVFVTGNIGDSSAGLAVLLDQVAIEDKKNKNYLINRHKKPIPQVKVGRLIAKLERASLNDISDGLASELHEIADASQLGIEINEIDLPVSSELLLLKNFNDINKWILFGGEDFELVGTTSIELWTELKQACDEQMIKITKIGLVTCSHSGVLLKRENQEVIKLEKSGYNHFNR